MRNLQSLRLLLADKDKEIEELKKELTEEKNAYIKMYNMYVEKDNIINELEKELFGMYVDIAGWNEDYAKKLIKKIEDSSQECELLKNNKKDVSIKSDELKCQFSDIWEYGDR